MGYLEDYEPYINEQGKADVEKMPEQLRHDILSEKKALVIFYNHIEDCRAELGTSEIVTALLYKLYDYDKCTDKDKFKMPDFKEYEPTQAAAARMIFRNMATAAKENAWKWIGRKVVNRYNGSRPKGNRQPVDNFGEQPTRPKYGRGITDLPGCS